MRLIVCCGQFPSLSETFVTTQLLGLERRGHTMSLVAEMLQENQLQQLQPGCFKGGLFGLGHHGFHPDMGSFSKLHLFLRSSFGLPGFLASGGRPHRYLRRGLRWKGILSTEAYRLARALPRADLVHAHFGPTALWARAIALRQKIPLVVTFHGYDATSVPWEFGWAAYRPLFDPPFATFIAHSPFVSHLLRNNLGVTPLRVPLGVDTELFSPSPRRADGEDRRGGPRLAFVGRLVPQKGVRIAIETLALLRQREKRQTLAATLDLVGEGPELRRAMALGQMLGVNTAIRVHGSQPPEGVARILRQADFLLVPSLRDRDGAEEAFGLACLEAQACGTLVVGTHCGGLPAAVSPPVGGRCVPQHDPSAMAAAVKELWFSSDMPSRRAAARARILAEHNLDAYLDGYEKAFTRALSTERREEQETPMGFAMPWRADEGEPRDDGSPWGSLEAYIRGRDVIELKRKVDKINRPNSSLARTWTSITPDRLERQVAPEGGGAEVILDLEGMMSEQPTSRCTALRRALTPGGMAILAVPSGARSQGKVYQSLQEHFREVLALDRLFTPSSRTPAFPLQRGSDLGNATSGPGASLKYLICVR